MVVGPPTNREANAVCAAASSITPPTAPRPRTVTSQKVQTESGLPLPASIFASLSTESTAAINPHAGKGHIHAHNAALSTILANRTLRNKYFPIITPLRSKRWEEYLRQADLLEIFSDVPIGIRDGWRLGYDEPLNSTFSPPNHASAVLHADAVRAYISKETMAGRYSGPFDPSHMTYLFQHYRASPIGVVLKDEKPRIVQDHSFPRNDPTINSLNSKIDVSHFKTSYDTFAQCYLYVAHAPPGSQAAVYDVDAAYRRMPLAPEDQIFVCLQFDGSVYIDHDTCFGSASSHGMLGRCADAIAAIYRFHGIQDLLKWVDDFIFLRYPANKLPPYLYTYDEKHIDNIAKDLGWPWAPKKHCPFNTIFSYIGLIWDLDRKTVYFSELKKTRYLKKIENWNVGNKVTRAEVDSVIDTLNHCSLVLITARTHLPSIYDFARCFNATSTHNLTKHPIPKGVVHDISWWREQLSANFCGMTLRPPPAPLPLFICMDASTSWGIGLWVDGKWLAWRHREGWNVDGRDIGWLEMVAVELALTALIAAGFKDTHFIFHSDNMGVVGALGAGSSRNHQQNSILRRIIHLFSHHGIWVTTKYIPTKQNPADNPSRGIFPPASDIFSPLPSCRLI